MHRVTCILLLSVTACDEGPCPGGMPSDLASCVDEDNAHVELEGAAIERVPGTGSWMAVQDHLASSLEDLGFEVERHDYGTGVNVIGVLPGTVEPERRVVIGAHYDHIEGCAGADDNASGVAGALEAARVLSTREYPRTLIIAFWDEEERGLLGSSAYVARELAAGGTFDVYFNFEMIGYYDDAPDSQNVPAGFDAIFPDAYDALAADEFRGDFIALVGDEYAHDWIVELGMQSTAIGLDSIPVEVFATLKNDDALRDLRRSDHAPFWMADIPAIMLTDTADFRYDAYHCRVGDDVTMNLDVERMSRVVSATTATAAIALGI